MDGMYSTQRTTMSFMPGSGTLRSRLQRVDWLLAGCAVLLIAMGLLYIWSAATTSFGAAAGAGFAKRQAVFFGIGLLIFLGAQCVDYRTLLRFSPVLYLICLVLLVAVLFTRPVNGARSWFDLGVIKFQPTELMKPVLVLTLAYFLIMRQGYKDLGGMVTPLILALVPMLLILKEPDLGGTMTLAPVVVAMLYAAGTRKRYIALMFSVSAITLVSMWFTVMKDYQKRRILAWIYPDQYSMAEAYQLIQAKVAIGAGGFFGQGHDSATSGLSRLPEKHNDFIFAVAAQEGGFAAAGMILTLLVLIGLSGLGIALRTREPAGRLIAVGLSVMMFWQAMINTGVALGLMPTTGQALPLVSYGGSSMLSCMFCLGLLIQIGSRQEQSLARDPMA